MRNSKLSPFPGLHLLDGVSRRTCRAIARLGTTVDLEPGRTLCREGVDGQQLFVVVRGVVTLSRDNVPRRSLGAGDAWDDRALGDPRTDMTAVTSSWARIHVYSDRELRVLGQLCPELAQKLLRTGARPASVRGAGVAIPPKVPVRAFTFGRSDRRPGSGVGVTSQPRERGGDSLRPRVPTSFGPASPG